jgi:integration host factor subunit beta
LLVEKDATPMSVLKKELVDQISNDLEIHKQDVTVAVDIILDSMAEALSEGRRVELRGFGSFSTRSRKARQTKNPRTGVMMDIGERKTIHFTMSKSLKEALINGKG